ncbi:molybdopterin cofactor-binding domain-containing protein, partial [Hungatella sp. SL.1.14]|uniref:molybdopterin cofactor-binding domain-containing protein n=1 Tax=Hungatella sp. SL.1.14 TaxID=2963703 RepID=UPI002108E885
KKGFEECTVVVEGTSKYDTISNPLPAESPGLVAWWDGPNQCNMKGSFQSPNIQKMIMQIAMPNVNVRVISANVGGSFGSKNPVPMEGLYCAALAKASGRPVKL